MSATMKTDDALFWVVAASAAALCVSRYPAHTAAVLKALSAPRPQSPEESQQTYNDFFSSSALFESERAIRKARDAANNGNQSGIVDGGSEGGGTFCNIRLVSLDIAPSMHQWGELLNDWRDGGYDFFVVGVNGFRFVVKNSRIGRLFGVARVHWYSLKTPQFSGGEA